jgi:hypothetical protein
MGVPCSSGEADDDEEGENAYVALLHGKGPHFLLYALQLGHRLRKLDPGTPRILLVGRALSGHPSFLEDFWALSSLEGLWKVRAVDLVDAERADRTSRKRHRFVFTKLRALEVPYRKVLFFDLDVTVRKDPSPLFEVPAPAGMYHGHEKFRRAVRHCGEISREALECGCINAGLMRLDPPRGRAARRHLLDEMLNEVAGITEEEQTFLPEQYYLVRKLSGWRHIDVSWNCEVNPALYIDEGFPCSQSDQLADNSSTPTARLEWADMPNDWWQLGMKHEELSEVVGMFHFSGNYLEPWWYLHLSADRARASLRKQFRHRDARGMVALAISDWLLSVEELKQDRALEAVEELVQGLKGKRDWWAWENAKSCKHCGGEQDGSRCEECSVRSDLNSDKSSLLPGPNLHWLPTSVCSPRKKDRSAAEQKAFGGGGASRRARRVCMVNLGQLGQKKGYSSLGMCVVLFL